MPKDHICCGDRANWPEAKLWFFCNQNTYQDSLGNPGQLCAACLTRPLPSTSLVHLLIALVHGQAVSRAQDLRSIGTQKSAVNACEELKTQ